MYEDVLIRQPLYIGHNTEARSRKIVAVEKHQVLYVLCVCERSWVSVCVCECARVCMWVYGRGRVLLFILYAYQRSVESRLVFPIITAKTKTKIALWGVNGPVVWMWHLQVANFLHRRYFVSDSHFVAFYTELDRIN